MATSVSTLRKFIAPDVIPCPEPIIDREILSAIQEYCELTHALRVNFTKDISGLTATTLKLDSVDIDLSTELASQRIVSVVRFNLDGTEWEPRELPLYEDSDIPDAVWEPMKEDNVMYFKITAATTLRVYERDPGSETYLFIELATKPSDTATTIPDNLYYDHREAILQGARYRILNMSSKEWSDPEGAVKAYIQWRRGVSKAKLRRFKNYTSQPGIVNPVQFCIEC